MRLWKTKAKTLMFVNCSPASSNLDETFMFRSPSFSWLQVVFIIYVFDCSCCLLFVVCCLFVVVVVVVVMLLLWLCLCLCLWMLLSLCLLVGLLFVSLFFCVVSLWKFNWRKQVFPRFWSLLKIGLATGKQIYIQGLYSFWIFSLLF